jgi:hypothetical protein
LFKQLAASPDKNLAQRCYSVAESVLASDGDYALCMDFIGEPEQRFKKLQDQWQQSKKSEQRQDDLRRQMDERMRAAQKQVASNGIAGASWSPPVIPPPPKTADKTFVGQTRRLIEILVGAGHKSDAEKIRDEAIPLLDDPQLKSAVEDAEKKIQTPKAGGIRASQSLPSSVNIAQPPPRMAPPALPPPPGGITRPQRSMPAGPVVPMQLTSNTQTPTPEEQVALIEQQRLKYREEGRSQMAQILPPAPSSAPINPSTGIPAPTQTPATNSDQNLLLSQQPPVIVETFPISGARDVPAGETEIRVRFSKPMQNGSWSWSTAWENSTPESIGSPQYLADGRTCVMKVRLAPGHTYAWWLNSDQFHNFKDAAGDPAVPYLLIFQTKPN